MFPLNSEFLLYVKAFIFLTCVMFWVKLAFDILMKGARPRSRRDRD